MEQIRLLEQLRELGVSGVALNAINSPGVQEKIDALVDQGIRVVTCNTDNSGSKRNCFVGFENELSGRVAAEILAKLTGETGDFIVGIGLKYILAHMHRLKGFSDKIRESYPDIRIREVIETGENNATALEKTLAALDAWPRVNGVYVTGYGANGIINALKIKKPDHRIRVLCHDHTPETDEYVNEGRIDAIICQDGARHGYEAMKILGEMVINNKEPKHQIYLTKLEIKFKENLHTPSQNWDI